VEREIIECGYLSDKRRVIKASGLVEEFDEDKLILSLVRSGLQADKVAEIAEEVVGEERVISTEDIYTRVKSVLQERYPEIALKYMLKRAIMTLGLKATPLEQFLPNSWRRMD